MSGAQTEAQAALSAMLERIPYARFLGVRAELAGDEMTMVMPFGQHIIGNPTLPAIHGGVLGSFMEMTALAQLQVKEGAARQPRVIDVSIEYLRSGRPLTTYARAEIKKVGRRIANVHVEAWQEQRASPIAALRAHFLLAQGES
ncbi:PaaI family thioesterase [Caulobacter sp. SLTY]|uniref:PaaI family thioesterase n=1 Tax=Caulobacter sp. SLTY TaxID=2683262 RepID=UPI001412E703|nr:PaaI family thioesterase [Caulobacter sp. SLTY]NBB14027.1 PaaI family thioesterase [Caulobacter sp. SLTY]